MSRYYKHGELKLPSVTTIISDCTDKSAPLKQWAANMVVEWIKQNIEHEPYSDANCEYSGNFYCLTNQDLDDARLNFKKVSQDALDIGSEVHNAIEMHLQDKSFNLTTKEAENAFKAFLSWADEHKLKPISIEQTVYGHGWAGTLDFYGYFGDKLYVIDWKSSKAHYPEMRYQVAAYRVAMENSDKIQGCGVLRLDKVTGLPDWKDSTKTYKNDLRVFQSMVRLYFDRHPIISRKAGR